MLPYFKIIADEDKDSRMQELPIKPRRNRRLEVPVHRQNVDATENVNKISRRYLSRENERLQQALLELTRGQEHLTKKNAKLKEKLAQFQTANEELANQNTLLKEHYEQILAELEKPKTCQNCLELSDHLDKTKRDYMALRKMHQEVQEDCGMLKNVVYRLNVQLERYQQGKSAKHQDAEDLGLGESHADHPHTPIAWGKVNGHTLAPLLNAYDETILEKEELIDSYQKEMASFTVRLKGIVGENEALHLRLNEDVECSKVLASQIDVLKAELKSTKEQNDLLIKKCALKQDKIEEILKCYEQKVDQVKRDYTVLHDQYYRSKTEISSLKEKNKALLESHDDFKNERQQYIPISVHNSSVNECKRWYEELKLQYESEKAKMTDSINQLKDQITDLTNKIATMNAEKVELEAKLKTADKHIKKAETKYLELEQSFQEVQLSRSACRKQLHKAMNFAKDLVSEQESLLKALNQRQQENKFVKRIGTDIASRMDLLRNELKTVQKEAWQELSTVEERIQEQDTIITVMKAEHEQEVERLKQIIKEKDKDNSGTYKKEKSSKAIQNCEDKVP